MESTSAAGGAGGWILRLAPPQLLAQLAPRPPRASGAAGAWLGSPQLCLLLRLARLRAKARGQATAESRVLAMVQTLLPRGGSPSAPARRSPPRTT
eukprot:3251833-Alexandrium_andersonii.AAC.1